MHEVLKFCCSSNSYAGNFEGPPPPFFPPLQVIFCMHFNEECTIFIFGSCFQWVSQENLLIKYLLKFCCKI